RRFAVRWQRVIELDDAQQIARLTLVTTARRISNPATAPAFLKSHIHGALQHWLRDHSRLVQIPRRAQEASGYAFPFGHCSLNAPSASTGVSLLEALSEVPVREAEPSALPVEIEDLLDSLPAHQAAMIRLHVLEGVSLREAGAQQGVSHSTAERRVKQGLASLRDLLA
ncbi:MAG TPA: sigma-70 family RNA polymerase sigma factor, partial [Cyanobium sp.]|nr:sigma-70 family RNA polymerase sigma factor [Cyanobium sp.]